MYNYLGGVRNDKRSDDLDAAFKQEKSNFRLVIVVDMWITGFDVPSLTYMYNDKPLKKHLLIQTMLWMKGSGLPASTYTSMINQINALATEARSVGSRGENPAQCYMALKEYEYKVFEVLKIYVPLLLSKEDFFISAF